MRRIVRKLVRRWRVFWLSRAGYGFWGRIGSRLAGFRMGGYRTQATLAWMTPKGYISPDAEIDVDLRRRSNVYVADRAVILRTGGDGFVELHDGVQINRDCTLEIFKGGSITIGQQVGLQRGCILVAAEQPIIIGRHAEIAPYCAIFSYDHGTAAGREIFGQPLTSKGPVIIGEDAWLGTRVTVLSGVTIGRGAVIGAGSVVVCDIPDHAIAAGVPARVIKYRSDAAVGGNTGT
jgi:acetyltransferase-like isoleucine patch superfamily enzyme